VGSTLSQAIPKTVSTSSPPNVGAVVIGGDYQGLGIVRSLGQQGVPVCVVDDELSIARYSRYTTKFVKVANLRDERTAVDNLLEIGKRLGLEGWVLYPTRDELVAALSRYRAELTGIFRVPTPAWESVKWAWDKRNTYQLAQELGIPTPVTHNPKNLEGLALLDTYAPPFAVKPAIKEHFFYATKAKAWGAASHSELRALFQSATEVVKPEEIIVQELIPGGGSQQFSYCAFFRDGKQWARWSFDADANTLCNSDEPAPMWRPSTFLSWKNCPSDFSAPSITTVSSNSNISSTHAIPNTNSST